MRKKTKKEKRKNKGMEKKTTGDNRKKTTGENRKKTTEENRKELLDGGGEQHVEETSGRARSQHSVASPSSSV